MSLLQETEQRLRQEINLGADRQVATEVSLPQPKIIHSASLKIAADLDQNGQWSKSTDHYYTIMEKGDVPGDRAEAFIGLVQNYINLVCYDAAEKLLRDGFVRIENDLTGWEKDFYRAQVWQKLGWVYDYYGKPEEASEYFKKSLAVLEERAEDDDRVLRVYETSNHFLGRQLVIMARQGKSPKENVQQAIKHFTKSMEIYKNFRAKGKTEPAAEGFQYSWLARCHMILGQFDLAVSDIEQMKVLFEEEKSLYPGTGVLGYYYLLLGRLKIELNQPQQAEQDFNEALKINREVVQYRASEADALYGLALCALMQNQKDQAKRLTLEAIQLNPHLLIRGFI